MDSQNLSAVSIRELGAAFMTALEEAGPELLTVDLDGIERRLQVLVRQVVGRVVEQTVATIAAQEAGKVPSCATCGGAMRLVDRARERRLQGLVGDYTLHRPYFVCAACHHGVAPLDEHLGLGAGALSPGLARVACRHGIEDPFGADASILQESLGVDVPAESIRRITEGVGAVVESETQEQMARARQGEAPAADPLLHGQSPPTVLAVEVDGIMVHTDGAWHEAKVGTVAPLGPATRTDPDHERAILTWGQASSCVGIEGAEDFWFRVYGEACRRGLGSNEVATVVVLGDGAEWIWHAAARFLGIDAVEVVEIVDLYHAVEHLWTVAAAVFGAGSAGASAWVEPLKQRLITDGAGPVIAALGALDGEEPTAAEEVRKALGYFTAQAPRMDYPAFGARAFPIGSGAVESAGKLLVGAREKGAGMRWTHTGAQAVASLRALHRSGRWQAFWQAHPQRRRPAVFSRPAGPPTDAPSARAA